MNEFITIDFETAVSSPESAISVGMVKYRNYQIIDSYYSLICPPRLYIRPDFTELHGLTVNDVKDAPDFKHLWINNIFNFIDGRILAAHNASFDMKVLKAVLEYYKLPIPKLSYFCTLALARQTWNSLESYALTALAKHFDIVYNAHNALDDAFTCGKLLQMSAEKFGKRKGIRSLLKVAKTKIEFLKSEE